MKKILTIASFLFINNIIAQEIIIKLNAGNYLRNKTIIETALPLTLQPSASYKIVNELSRASALIQQIDSKRILFILPEVLQPHQSATYKLVKTGQIKKSSIPVKVEKNKEGLLVKVQNKNVLFYNTAVIRPPKHLSEIYSRSGFIHPLYSPSGKVLTDDFPEGHAHQHGIMMAWTSTLFKGKAHDFWNQHQNTGNVKHIQVESIETGPVASSLKLNLQHYSKLFGEVLNELWTITVYPFKDNFIFDIRSAQTNTSADTLFLNKYLYGGMAFRGSKQWNKDDSVNFKNKWNILTDSGATLSNANGKPAAYVSASGLIDNNPAGLTIFGFPTNFNYPQPIRVHPVMPYWCFAPTVTAPFTIKPKELFTSKYRYYVYDGMPDEARIEQINNDILHPIEISFKDKN